VTVFGMRDGVAAEVASIEVADIEDLPAIEPPSIIGHHALAGYDPLGHLGEEESESPPALADRRHDEDLPPLAATLELTANVAARLRSLGIDPSVMTLEELTVGLLRIGGYQVTPMASADPHPTYLATKGGTRTTITVVAHGPGDHPELSENIVNRFCADFAQAGIERGLLVTDEYGPYLIYDKERRQPRTRFITRERLQGFVDSFALN